MSRALLHPIPDRPALSAARSMLYSVKPGKSLSRDPLSNLVIKFSGALLLQDRVAVHSKNVVDAADTICGS